MRQFYLLAMQQNNQIQAFFNTDFHEPFYRHN